MSIKIFHIIFIVLATILSFGFAAWAFFYCRNADACLYCGLGIGSIVVGIAFIIYGNKFFKKLILFND